MSDSLAAFLTERIRDIDNQARTLEAQMRKLEDERKQLETAGRAVGLDYLFDYNADHAAAFEAVEASAKRSGKVASERTIKEAVVEILSETAGGMRALDILAAINLRFGFDYPRTSLSPQLSRLKAAGEIERDGMMWKIVSPTAQKEEAVDPLSEWDEPTASKPGPTFQGGVFD